MYALYVFGPRLEHTWGAKKFSWFYVLCALGGVVSDDLAVVCDKKRISEVRVCLTKTFAFRACPEVAQRACKLERMMMPAVRGG